jgi:hypothetical protein
MRNTLINYISTHVHYVGLYGRDRLLLDIGEFIDAVACSKLQRFTHLRWTGVRRRATKHDEVSTRGALAVHRGVFSTAASHTFRNET